MYCTLEDIKKAIPESDIVQLTDDETGSLIDNEKVEEAIAYAEDIINGYLRGRYPVPIDPVPGLIRRLAVDLAIYQLYSRRLGLEMPQSIIDRRKEVIRLLENIQAGKLTLGIETRDSPGQGYYKGSKKEEDKIFNKDLLNRF